MITHTDDCIHQPMYGGDEPCEHNEGEWLQPQAFYVGEAESELGDDAPWCAVHQRAWELQEEQEEAESTDEDDDEEAS